MTSTRLERLDYPFEALQALMLEHDLTTIQLVWRESPDRFRARDPFPVGGVVEDPATGAAAAALGAYLRARGEITPPAVVRDRPGRRDGPAEPATVSIVPGEAGVRCRATPSRSDSAARHRWAESALSRLRPWGPGAAG